MQLLQVCHLSHCGIVLFSYAPAPSDYIPQQPYTVTFPAGSVRESFNVTIVDDNLLERDETFLLNIVPGTTPNGVIIGQPNNTEVTIVETTGKYVCNIDEVLLTFLISSFIF